MILESIVTSVDAGGMVNIAPMGPLVEGDLSAADATEVRFVLRPFNTSHTYRNLIATRHAVIHVTDDVELFAEAAVDAIDAQRTEQLVERLAGTDWWRLHDCHRWFAIEVESISGDEPRAEMSCRVVRSEVVRPFFGFNRAKHAVIEAAILATRTHILPAEEIRAEVDRLVPLIDKTAGPAEHRAFGFLRTTIEDRLARG